ncbi:hypothetical protein [Hanstruepera flava]|uniref:hypothetical protein n=1 Tax=Hanstruepera flava TaxID=2930218 RepID=UPI002028C559|nr:hypothetical protein [Hanstruepera flava]
MKLVIVTTVEAFHNDVIKLFKKSGIENFSESEIDGYKSAPTLLTTNSWFANEKGGNESSLFFSFTTDDKIDNLFKLIQDYNNDLETNNPIRAVVLPIERNI